MPGIDASAKSIRWGSEEVPLLRREWLGRVGSPYRRTYDLTPGDLWFNAPTTTEQSETYVAVPGEGEIPVGAAIARELRLKGAIFSGFTEMWGGFVLVDHSLACVEPPESIARLISDITAINNGSLSGFPDVVATFEDGRFAFREAKHIATNDRLSSNQHQMADVLRSLLGNKLDLAVVAWGR